jgi:hypothetical protein
MTEFELKQLEFMEIERMQGLLGLIQSQVELISNDATMMSTLLFGYLVVAYFVGGKLTRIQSFIFSALYLAGMLGNLFSASSSAIVAIGFQAKFIEVSGASGAASLSPMFVLLGVVMNLGMLLASLYFMWSVRHPKAE